MKRWLLLSIIAVVIVVASATAVRSYLRSVAQKKREATYQSALRQYSQELSLGLRRTEVERYLRARNANFLRISTAFGGRHEVQNADILKIGEEPAPWFCSAA